MPNWICGDGVWTEVYFTCCYVTCCYMFTFAGILEETEPEPSFTQLVHDHLSLLLNEFEHYFPTTKDSRTAMEWIRDPFVNKPVESSMSMQEVDQLLDIANDGGLKSMLEVFWCSGLKSQQNTLRSPQQHWKPCCHFQHPICVKWDFLQWQQPNQIME